MDLLKSGAGLLGAGLSLIKNIGIRAQLKAIYEDSPTIRYSKDIGELLDSILKNSTAYNVLLTNIERGVYAADKELLVGDALAILARLYPNETFVSVEETIVSGRRKNRIRKAEEVVDGLTTLLLNNWKYVNDSMKHDMELFVAYIYMTNKIIERTHYPLLMNREPIVPTFGMRILILLDCIAQLEQLNRSRNIIVSKSHFETYNDEMTYIRSKLKPPRSTWQRGEYDWSKDKDSCWVVSAYYGNPYHPNVQTIRELRDSLLAKPLLGPVIEQVNVSYYRLGESAFGSWWRRQLADSQNNLPRLLSACICRFLLLIIDLLAWLGKTTN